MNAATTGKDTVGASPNDSDLKDMQSLADFLDGNYSQHAHRELQENQGQPEVKFEKNVYTSTTESTWSSQHLGTQSVSQTITGETLEGSNDQPVELPVQIISQNVVEDKIEPVQRDSKSDVKIVLSFENEANELETRTISDLKSDASDSSSGNVLVY